MVDSFSANYQLIANNSQFIRGISSADRAPALHAGGQRFESVILHKKVLYIIDVDITVWDS